MGTTYMRENIRLLQVAQRDEQLVLNVDRNTRTRAAHAQFELDPAYEANVAHTLRRLAFLQQMCFNCIVWWPAANDEAATPSRA